MTNTAINLPPKDEVLDLEISRVVDVPREKLWKAWTTPGIAKKWFAPAPWTVAECEIDPRPGGIFCLVMRSPEGEETPRTEGCVLEAVPHEKFVWTDSLQPGFRPAANAFMTAEITFEDHKEGTLYTARVLHKNTEDRQKHADMGFESGWNQCLDQLIAIARTL